MKRDLLYPSEAAALLSVTTRTLRRWESDGLIRAVRRSGTSHRRYVASDVERIRRTALKGGA